MHVAVQKQESSVQAKEKGLNGSQRGETEWRGLVYDRIALTMELRCRSGFESWIRLSRRRKRKSLYVMRKGSGLSILVYASCDN